MTLDDLKKSNSRSRNAFILSILAIIISVIFGILDYTKPEKSDNNVDNNSNNGKIQTDSTSQINHSQLKRDSINKTAIKVISDSSKHWHNFIILRLIIYIFYWLTNNYG